MKDKSIRSGYIMIFTLLAVGAAMVVVTYIGYRGSFYLPFARMIHAREKAEMLVLGGVQVAIAQLSQPDKKEDQEKEGQQQQVQPQEEKKANKEEKEEGVQATAAPQGKTANSAERDFLSRILPTLNRWQEFQLTENVDGIDGQIKICLMCEEGKINLNRIIDFKKGVLRGSEQSGWKMIMQELCKLIEQHSKTSGLFPALEKIAKDATFQFNDATELVTRKEFNNFKDALFYQPPTQKNRDTLYLTDIFTVWSSSDKLEPWLFSDSISGLLGLPRVEIDDTKKRKEQTAAWVKNFKARASWQQDWQKILMPVYGKELRTLPKNIDSMLSTTFAPRFFSVLVHAQVDEVTQSVYAILERNKSTQGDTGEYDVTIKKLYWL